MTLNKHCQPGIVVHRCYETCCWCCCCLKVQHQLSGLTAVAVSKVLSSWLCQQFVCMLDNHHHRQQ